MKIQCNVCEAAEARVLCCADEAALCWDCDEKVHAANKLAGKHQRVPLSAPSSAMPKCDICQETVGYFFCLEDRALLCRKCDLAIHTANAFVSGHQRFLLTGVKVGLESTEPLAPPSSSGKALSEEKRSEAESPAVSKRAAPIPPADEFNVSGVHVGVDGVQDLEPPPPPKVSFIGGGSIAGSIPQWQVDDYIGLSEFHSGFDYMGNGSSKADSGKLGESDSPVLRAGGEELDDDECLGQVPDSSWTVPQIPSPPTASGLYWPRSLYNSSDYTVFVPDLSYSQMQIGPNSQSSGTASKRRRQF